jgi:hypothetical protein
MSLIGKFAPENTRKQGILLGDKEFSMVIDTAVEKNKYDKCKNKK